VDQGERRIHSLKLRGGDDALLLRARYRLEEAFRTATLPGLPPNAQVLVRRLDLGSITCDVSPASLAEFISEKVRALAAVAVCLDFDSKPCSSADVVWFSDPLRPYVVLLGRLLDGKPVSEWYWRSLFPRQSLTLSSSTIEMLLTESIVTPLKVLAPARLLQHALAPHRWARLCTLITPEMARRMLHAQGLSPVAVRWKYSDYQTRAVAVRAIKPIAAPTLTSAWRRVVQDAAIYWGAEDVRTLWCAWQVLLMHQPGYLERKDSLQRIDVAGWLAVWPAEERDGTNCIRCDDEKNQISPGPSVLKGGDEQRGERLNHPQNLSPAHTSPPLLQRGDRGDLSERGHDSSGTQDARQINATSASEVTAPYSLHAGFAFLIPLMQRLGMSELLQRNDVLLELDFPRRLLWAMVERFAVAEDDPLRQLFEQWEPGADVVLEDEIRLPELWSRMTTRSGRPLLHRATTLRDAVNATELMASVYLRRFCGISLLTLLQRPGRVLLTPTHWDAIFDINQTDLRLRRVALDTDPGWVPWLGRVVQFHYDSEGQRYG
jgi:hypothetical protein